MRRHFNSLWWPDFWWLKRKKKKCRTTLIPIEASLEWLVWWVYDRMVCCWANLFSWSMGAFPRDNCLTSHTKLEEVLICNCPWSDILQIEVAYEKKIKKREEMSDLTFTSDDEWVWTVTSHWKGCERNFCW